MDLYPEERIQTTHEQQLSALVEQLLDEPEMRQRFDRFVRRFIDDPATGNHDYPTSNNEIIHYVHTVFCGYNASTGTLLAVAKSHLIPVDTPSDWRVELLELESDKYTVVSPTTSVVPDNRHLHFQLPPTGSDVFGSTYLTMNVDPRDYTALYANIFEGRFGARHSFTSMTDLQYRFSEMEQKRLRQASIATSIGAHAYSEAA